MIRKNPDGTTTLLTLPNHKQIKSSTLRNICTQAGISLKLKMDFRFDPPCPP